MSPCLMFGRNFWITHCSRKVAVEQIVKRAEIEILAREPEHRLAAFAVERLHHDVAVLGAERLDLGEVARHQRRGHQVGKLGDEHLLRRVAHMRRIVDHQRPGMDALEQVGRRHIGEVERRILAQQHHVKFRELHAPRLTQREMVAGLVAHAQGFDMGEHAAVEQRQPVGRVICKLVTAFLRFQQQGEGRVAFNIDPLDRIHLHRDFEAHDYL